MKKAIVLVMLAAVLAISSACGSNAGNEQNVEKVNEESTTADASDEEATEVETTDGGSEEIDDSSISHDENEPVEDAPVIYEEDYNTSDDTGGAVEGENGEMLFPCTLEDAQIAAEAFLQLETEGTKAVISNNFICDEDFVMERHQPGEIFTFIDLLGMVKEEYIRRNENVMPEISYAFINNNNSGNYSFAVKFGALDIYSVEDGSYAVYVFQPNGDILYLIYSSADWCRHRTFMNEYGYTACLGSAGAGESPFDEGVITKYGKYEFIYRGDATCGMWTGSDLGVADEYIACVEEDTDLADLYVDRFDIGDDRVCLAYNEFFDRHDMETITPVIRAQADAHPVSFSEKTQEFMIMCAENGKVNWITEEELIGLIGQRRDELNVKDKVLNAAEVEWTLATIGD